MENEKQETAAEPRVTVLGAEVNDKAGCGWRSGDGCRGQRCPCGRYDRCRCCGGGFGGLVFILAGVLLLLCNAGLVSWSFWGVFVPLWPIIIVVIGLKMIMGRNAASRALLSFAVLAAFVIVALAGLVKTASPAANYLHLPGGFVEFLKNLNL